MTTPPSRLPRPWNGEGEAIWMVPLLRAEGGEKEPQVGLVVGDLDCQGYPLFIPNLHSGCYR